MVQPSNLLVKPALDQRTAQFTSRRSKWGLRILPLLGAAALGCSSNPKSAATSSRDPDGSTGPSQPLTGCTAHATAHAAAAKVESPQPSDAPLACTVETGLPAINTALVIDDAGAILFAPAGGNTLALSRDNGASWETELPEGGDAGAGLWLHPFISRDRDTGRIFFNAFAIGVGANGCKAPTGADLWFGDHVDGTLEHRSVGCDSYDWGKTVTGPPVTDASKQALQASGYPNVVYYCATGPTLIVGPNRMCYRSVDGGNTFTRTASDAIDSARGQRGYPNQGAVAPDGTIYEAHPSDQGLAISTSHDEGDSWADVYVTGSVMTGPSSSWLGSNVATDREGNLYAVWVDDRDRLPYVSVSKDRGTTWTTPLMISIPEVAVSNYPNIAVKEPGYLAVAYYGSSDKNGNGNDGYLNEDGRAWNAYLVVTTNVLADAPRFWTATLTTTQSPAIDSLAWTKSEYVGPPAFAPDGSIWAAFVHAEHGLAARIIAPP